MFYSYFRTFNLISNIFGLTKPIITAEGKSIKINLWLKLWSLIVAAGLISSYAFSIDRVIEFDIKDDMEIIPDINDLFINIIILLINLMKSEKIYINIQELLDNIFKDLSMDDEVLQLFAYKMYLWYFTPTVLTIILIVLELLIIHPPFILLIRIPTFLSIMHLIMHLYLILALLKMINIQLTRILMSNDKKSKMIPNGNIKISNIIKYIISPNIEFIRVDDSINFDLKYLCKLYDDLSTSVHLLEKCYGLQVFLSIWAMFTSGVVGVTVIVSEKLEHKWLVVIKSILPFLWCFIGCYINDQTSKEVDQTITLIIKCLIDFRCVPSRRPTLETFKELVSNDRLQFSACSLFNLSYSMLLGTLLNVVTYSIILIQMF